jgi:hypothetical protein
MKLPARVLFPLGHLGLSHTNTKCPLFLFIEFKESKTGYAHSKQKTISFRGQASSAKMTSFGGKLTAQACHLTKK